MQALGEPFTPLPDEVADALPALMAYVDRNQRYRFVNRAYRDWFGRGHADLLGRTVREIVGEAGYAEILPHIEAALAGREVQFTVAVTDAVGRGHHLEARYAPDFGPDGEVNGYYSLLVDRSEEVRREQRDREREERFRLILEASGFGDWSWDRATDIVTLSPRGAEIFGLAPQTSLTWASLQTLLHPDDLEQVRRAVIQTLARGAAYDVECRVRRPSDGAEAWLLVRGRAQYDQNRRPVGMLGVVGDITPSKAEEAQVRVDRQRLEELERAQTFLLRLSDAMREAQEPNEVLRAACSLLGQHLGVRRVGFGEADETLGSLSIIHDWTDGVVSLVGSKPMVDFQKEMAEQMRQVGSLVIEDVMDDPRTAAAEARAAFAAIDVGSTVGTPLILGGRMRAILFVHHDRPRAWFPHEVRLIEQAAERIWTAVQRARAEVALRDSEVRFRTMADTAPAPVWVTAADGSVLFVNQAFADYAGCGREALPRNYWSTLLHPEDLPEVIRIRQQARERVEPYAFEARFRRKDGEYRWMQASSKPRLDENGRFQGFVGIAVDLTDVRRAEAALRESEQRFRHVAEDAPVMLWMADEKGRTLYLNRALRSFYGVGEDLESFDWKDYVLEEDRDASSDAVTRALDGEAIIGGVARWRRHDGEIRTVFTRGQPRRDAEGRLLGMIGVSVDITDARRAEARQQLLINELNHRVKNTLATVQSLAWQTMREGVVTKEAREIFTARLLALSAAHNVLTRESWESAELRDILTEALRPYEDPAHERFCLAGPAVRLAPGPALALSMAVHELCTNAVKYGALSSPGGRVDVRWSPGERPGELSLQWKETGGPPVKPPTHKGFGSRLLGQNLAAELGGKVEMTYDPAGLVCQITARLPD